METVFLLKQQYEELAVAEAKAASFGWGWWEHKERPMQGVLVLETRKAPQQLALSRFAMRVIGSCAPGNLKTTIDALKIPIKGSFKLELHAIAKTKFTPSELGGVLWRKQKNPKVNLEHPDTIVDIIITEKVAYIGVRIWTNTEDFESRRAHLRAELHPSGMHPALARALVNITCAKSVHDPFCGTGGIVLEAALAHKKASGADIDPQMVARTKANCNQHKLHPELRVADATLWIPRVQAVVADLPYGKSTTPVALKPLLDTFLHRAGQSTTRAVVGLPAELPMPWSVRAHFSIYVHKSLTRHFYLLEKH